MEAQFDVAKTNVAKFNGNEKTKPTTTKLLSEHCEALKIMPTVYLALKLGVTLGASTAKCENSFSVLNTIMRDRKQSMKHASKAHLAQLAFESDLTKKLKLIGNKTSFDNSVPQIVACSYFSKTQLIYFILNFSVFFVSYYWFHIFVFFLICYISIRHFSFY